MCVILHLVSLNACMTMSTPRVTPKKNCWSQDETNATTEKDVVVARGNVVVRSRTDRMKKERRANRSGNEKEDGKKR